MEDNIVRLELSEGVTLKRTRREGHMMDDMELIWEGEPVYSYPSPHTMSDEDACSEGTLIAHAYLTGFSTGVREMAAGTKNLADSLLTDALGESAEHREE